ncbi:TIGR00266 family protein [Candidatus Alkanophaga liquidiphilum]|nr:AIM24 protein [Candidatus Alkanophaga liquidiphilum]
MEYKIIGDNLQVVEIMLGAGEGVYAEAGAMVYMSGNVKMEAKAKGGFLKGLKRKLVGETFFLTEFSTSGGPGVVAFAGNAPGTIQPVKISSAERKEFIAQKDAFLCAEDGVDLGITFTKKLGAAIFGGEGFILEKFSGEGLVFLHACGDFIEKELNVGETLKVDTGCIVGFDASVRYDIEFVGVKSALFGGEGVFVATLTGPGRVLLQSMTLHNLAAALRPFLSVGTSGADREIGFKIGGFKMDI